MNKQTTPTFMTKIISTLFLMFCVTANLSLFAQNNEQVLNETTMRTQMDANKNAGKATFDNIYSKFVIGTNDKVVSAKDSAQLVANIKKLPEVIGCNYSPSKHSLVVKCKKTDETNNFIIKIKGEVVPFGVFILKNEEIIYTTKK